jgi:hypothetical protein
VPLPVGFAQGAANPTVKFDDVDHDPNEPGVQNRAYIAFMAATFNNLPPLTNPSGLDPDDVQYRSYGMTANNGIFVASTDDGGLTWNANDVRTVASHLSDGTTKVAFDIIPDLAIDTFATLPNGQSNPHHGTVYVTFSRYYPSGQYPGEPDSGPGSNVMIAASTDGGEHWDLKLEPNPAESPDPGNPIISTVIYNSGYFAGTAFADEGLGVESWAHVTVGPEGDVYVSQFLGGTFVVHHSTNGANSFEHPNPQTGALFPFRVNVPTIPGSIFPGNNFRLQTVRAVAADPTRPGTVYVAEARPAAGLAGNTTDEGEVVFARSNNYGAAWQRTFGAGSTPNANVVNDENDGLSAAGGPNDVAATQALPRLVVDAAGNIALIWYDARRDPASQLLDVYAAISTDGGQTFSPNFRITDQSFDPDAGQFTDATGNSNFYLGDFLGLAPSNSMIYAAWTDTRGGNQDIYFRRLDLAPIPAPPNDRFEQNNDIDTATDLGTIVERSFSKLSIPAGDEDWFRVRSGATGPLIVRATLDEPGENIRLELRNANGDTLATGVGNGLSTELSWPSDVGQTYFVHVLPPSGVGTASDARYTLSVESLTANLGTRVHGILEGSLSDGDELYYSIVAAAAGSLDVTLAPNSSAQGSIHLELIDSATFEPLALGELTSSSLQTSAPVEKGQKIYIRVAGDAASRGEFALEFNNWDQFTTESNQTAFIPTGYGPSETVLADLNMDGHQDIVVSHVGQNVISVILNYGDGTFQAPREFDVGAFLQEGPFTLFGVPNYHRDLAVANFNPDEDNYPDVIAVNPSSGDVSLLLGNGDGTFRPHRRFDATDAALANLLNDANFTSVPFALAVGDVNNDGNFDFVAIDSSAVDTAQAAVRLGRADGTFQAPRFFSLPNREENRTNAIRLADVNNDGNLDLVERDFRNGTSVMFGNGDGTFQTNVDPLQRANGPGLTVADLNGDGELDIVTTLNNSGDIQYSLGHGNGAFDSSVAVSAGQFPIAVVVADFGSALELPDGSTVVGPPDGHPDLIVANNGRPLPSARGPAEVVFLPGLVDPQSNFNGFGVPIRLASPQGPLDVQVANVNSKHDDALDIVVVERDGILVIYGEPPTIPPNDTMQIARDLGTVVHLVQPTLTIVPGHTNAFYKLTVPAEAFAGSGNQVLDFSGGFANKEGAGLMMEVLDAAGNLLPDNIAEYHRQVRKNGLDIPDLDETFYGMTEFRIDDPDGNRLWIGQDKSRDD